MVLAKSSESLVEVGIPELDDLPGRGAHHVVVPATRFHLLVEVVLASETTLAHQSTLHQQVEGPVNGCPGHLALFRLHPCKQIIRVEMLVGCEDLVEERQTLLGDLEIVLPQMLDE